MDTALIYSGLASYPFHVSLRVIADLIESGLDAPGVVYVASRAHKAHKGIILGVKPMRWSAEKSLSLKAERGVSFEEVLSAISQGGLLGVMDHPNRAKYGHQKMLAVRIRDYVYLVPYVESEKEIFLKSIMPSRKATRDFLSGDK